MSAPLPAIPPVSRLVVGTSGYAYKDWIGPFYPEGTKLGGMLAAYAARFDAVELNYTYYKMPDADGLVKMAAEAAAVNPRFTFAVKAHRTQTHEIAAHWRADADAFKEAFTELRMGAGGCQDEGVAPRFMIRDNDGKFQGSFDTALKRIGMEAKKTPIRAPNANAFVESWISHARSECLNYFGLIFGLGQLDRILARYRRHHNLHRPHQGKDIGNKVLDGNFVPKETGTVQCESSLGGLLRHYYRDSA